MTGVAARSLLRGHSIYHDGEQWRFSDSDEPTADTWTSRGCGHCGLADTPEGHDGCLGTVPGVMNACCGHGVADEAYVQLDDGTLLQGQVALAVLQGRIAEVE